MQEMMDKILQIESKYMELGEILSEPEVIQDFNRFKTLSKQRKAMEETVEVYHKWKDAQQAVNDAKDMLKSENDETMRSFLHDEIKSNEQKMSELEERLKEHTNF